MTEQPNCVHEYEWKEPTRTEGPNILGQDVINYGQDGVCSKCQATTWRRTEKENYE